MDADSSSKFIGSLTKFLQSLCNGYVEFETGVELIGHIYLSVDSGKQFKKIDYILNEKVCKNDNSVTFISNSFHAHPLEKTKPSAGKKTSDDDGRREDDSVSEMGDAGVPRSTNSGTMPVRTPARSAPSPNQNRVTVGSKRPGSPLKGPSAQRRPSSPPLRRGQKGPIGSPASTKTVPSSPSSSSQDNIPSPSAKLKGRGEGASATQVSTDDGDPDLDSLVPGNLMPIHPSAAPDLSSFLGTPTRDDQAATSQERPDSHDEDTKPDTDVTFIKEEFMSEPSSCAQAGGSSQRGGRAGESQLLQDSSDLYPVMLHQNTAAFPGLPSGFPPGTSHAGFSQTSTSQSSSDPFANPVPGTSQDGTGADPSDRLKLSPRHWSATSRRHVTGHGRSFSLAPFGVDPAKLHSLLGTAGAGYTGETTLSCMSRQQAGQGRPSDPANSSALQKPRYTCRNCHRVFHYHYSMARHRRQCEGTYHLSCELCGLRFHRRDRYNTHLRIHHNTLPPVVRGGRPGGPGVMHVLPEEEEEERHMGMEEAGDPQQASSP